VNTNIYKNLHTHTNMKKESDKEEVSKEEEKKKEVRNLISCSNCGSHYVYVLKDGTIICRRCSHKTLSKK